MTFARHRDFRIRRATIGNEGAPLLVIDDLMANPEALVDLAATKVFGDVASFYPGIRAKVPLTFQQHILGELRSEFAQVLGLAGG